MTGFTLSRAPRPARPLLAVALLAAFLLAPVVVRAQGATDSSSTTTAVTSVEESNPSLGLVPTRPQGEITADINAAKAEASASEASLAPARERAVIAKGRLNIQKEELQTLETRMKLAKQIKNGSEMATLKVSIDKARRQLAYLARTEEAMRADVDRLEAEREAAKATITMFERELELQMLRNSPGIAGVDPRFPDLVRRTLDAQKSAADKRADAAARARSVAERQLTQLKALDKMAAPAK